MKIVYLITRSDTLGGAHIHVRDLAVALRAAGHEVTVLAGGEGAYTRILRERGVPCRPVRHLERRIRPLRDAAAVREIRSILRELRQDVVSTHSSKAGWLGRIAARSLGIPVIFTAHGWAFAEGVPEREARVYRWAERLAAPLAHRIITVSERDRDLALRHGIARSDALVAIHNGMPDVEHALRAAPGAAPPRMVMVARFEEQKDHPALFRALARLQELPWSVDLVGDGPLSGAAEALAAELGIAHRLRFLGLRTDVAEILRDAQLFLLISNWEGFPRSILEAMRAGLPVVASDVGGVSEAVVDGLTGYVVGRGDTNALHLRLAELLNAPDLRARMGAAGRQTYEERFTFQRMMGETVGVYLDVAAGRRSGTDTAEGRECASS